MTSPEPLLEFDLASAWSKLKAGKVVCNNPDDATQTWIGKVDGRFLRDCDVVPNPDPSSRKYHTCILVPRGTKACDRSKSEYLFFDYACAPFNILGDLGNFVRDGGHKPPGVSFTTSVAAHAKRNIKLTGGKEEKAYKEHIASLHKIREHITKSIHFKRKIGQTNISAGADAMYPFRRVFVPRSIYNRENTDEDGSPLVPDNVDEEVVDLLDNWVPWTANPDLYGFRVGTLLEDGSIERSDAELFNRRVFVRVAWSIRPYVTALKKAGCDLILEEVLYIADDDTVVDELPATGVKQNGRQHRPMRGDPVRDENADDERPAKRVRRVEPRPASPDWAEETATVVEATDDLAASDDSSYFNINYVGDFEASEVVMTET